MGRDNAKGVTAGIMINSGGGGVVIGDNAVATGIGGAVHQHVETISLSHDQSVAVSDEIGRLKGLLLQSQIDTRALLAADLARLEAAALAERKIERQPTQSLLKTISDLAGAAGPIAEGVLRIMRLFGI